MSEQPAEKKNTIVIVLVVLAAVTFLGVICCGVGGYFVYQGLEDMDKTYYAECEDLQEADDCHQCCRDKGHSGSLHGEIFNEEGKVCGCT